MTKNRNFIFNLLFAVCSFCAAVHAKDYLIEIRDAPTNDVLRLLAQMQGKNVVLPDKLDEPVTASFSSASLNHALYAVLDSKGLGALVRDDVIRILPKKTLEALGEDLATKTIRLKYANAKDVKAQIGPLASTRGAIIADERTNALSIRDTPNFVENIATFVESVDNADRQVLIEARIVQASKNFSLSYGLQWGVSYMGNGVTIGGITPPPVATTGQGTTTGASTGTTGTTTTPAGTSTTSSGGNFMQIAQIAAPLAGMSLGWGPFGGTSFDAQLSLAESNGDASVLARPSIVTMNNRPATIRSGTKFYVKAPGNISIGTQSTSASATTSNLQEINAGISMTVTPQITVDNKISLIINVTQSRPDNALSVDGVPAIADNSATTTVLLQDGETTVIGGLFQYTDSNNSDGIPFINRIPVLGALFGRKSKDYLKQELIIFIKPSIVREAIKTLTQNS